MFERDWKRPSSTRTLSKISRCRRIESEGYEWKSDENLDWYHWRQYLCSYKKNPKFFRDNIKYWISIEFPFIFTLSFFFIDSFNNITEKKLERLSTLSALNFKLKFFHFTFLIIVTLILYLIKSLKLNF